MLKIRMPVILEFTLTDFDLKEIAERIREDRGDESARSAVDDAEIATYLCELVNDDLESALSEFGLACHPDEAKTTCE